MFYLWTRTKCTSTSKSTCTLCMYFLMLQMTPDRDFIIDRHPAHRNIVIGAGFSGEFNKANAPAMDCNLTAP